MQVKFSSDTKYRKQWLTGLHFSHPAKMHLSLLLFLIDRYTNPGDVVLDPMAGSGTILVACSMGRNVIAVDLEDKFVSMMEGNWQKIQQRGPQMGYRMGQATILQGDARDLEGVVCDSIITSPAYGNAATGVTEEAAIRRKERLEKAGDNTQKLLTPGRYSHGNLGIVSQYNKDNPSNIQNLAYGSIDSVITSPPYTNRMDGGGEPMANFAPYSGDTKAWFTQRPSNNIGNLAYGSIDSVITSPPYAEVSHHTDNPQDTEKYLPGRTSRLAGTAGEQEGNIGNLKSDSYLQAMLQVYQQCHKVLKAEGLMALVLKNFIRDKQVIRLDLDTIRLCEQSGFTLEERHYRKLSQQSFWRTIALQKCDHRGGSKTNPKCKLGLVCPVKQAQQLDLIEGRTAETKIVEELCPHYINTMPELKQEDILVFRKDGEGGIVDEVVMSPPYAESTEAVNQANKSQYQKPNTIMGKRRGTAGGFKASGLALPEDKNNIGNLPYGEIDKVL